jgi:hypothetical protein
MRVSAVLDRFEEGYAVILLNEGNKKLVIPKNRLPKSAREGHWLLIEFEGQVSEETLLNISVDKEETLNAKRRIAEKLDRLRRGDHFGDE